MDLQPKKQHRKGEESEIQGVCCVRRRAFSLGCFEYHGRSRRRSLLTSVPVVQGFGAYNINEQEVHEIFVFTYIILISWKKYNDRVSEIST